MEKCSYEAIASIIIVCAAKQLVKFNVYQQLCDRIVAS